MIKDIQTASFFLKDGINDNSSFRWCFCPGEGGDVGEAGGQDAVGYGGVADEDIGSGVEDSLSVDEARSAVEAEKASRAQTEALNLSPKDVQSLYTGMLEDPMNFGFEQEQDPNISKRYKEPRIIPKKIPYTLPLLQDPVQMLPKLKNLVDKDTAKELSATYVDMLKVAGVEAAAMDPKTKDEEEQKTGLIERIQKELDKGLLADFYQDYTPMNALEKAGFKTFGTGYRGAFEARTGVGNKAVSRNQYDPNTITGAGTGERSEKIALFNQFALENPMMTAREAMAAFNDIGSFGTISAVDLGMLGYSPDSRVGPQAESNEAERERGALQGLGMLGQVVVGGPMSMIGIAEKMALSGTPEDTVMGTILGGINNATKGEDGVGIVDEVNSVYDSFTNTLEEARDAVVDAVQENVFDPVADFFSPEQEAAYNPAIGMADPNLAGRSGISFTGSPFSGLPSDTFENYTNALAGLEEAEAAPGTVAADKMAEALQNAAYYDSLMNPEAISPPEPSSFFTGLDPVETQEYIDRVTTPKSTKLIRQRQPVPAAPLPTVADQFSPVETKNFFPGSFSQPPGKSRTRTQTLADLYNISEDEANRMLGIA